MQVTLEKIFLSVLHIMRHNRLLPIVCQEADVWNGEDHL